MGASTSSRCERMLSPVVGPEWLDPVASAGAVQLAHDITPELGGPRIDEAIVRLVHRAPGGLAPAIDQDVGNDARIVIEGSTGYAYRSILRCRGSDRAACPTERALVAG